MHVDMSRRASCLWSVRTDVECYSVSFARGAFEGIGGRSSDFAVVPVARARHGRSGETPSIAAIQLISSHRIECIHAWFSYAKSGVIVRKSKGYPTSTIWGSDHSPPKISASARHTPPSTEARAAISKVDNTRYNAVKCFHAYLMRTSKSPCRISYVVLAPVTPSLMSNKACSHSTFPARAEKSWAGTCA